MHPYRRSALIGTLLGVPFGATFYLAMRLTGHHANGYLVVAIVAFSIPGSVIISMTSESGVVDGRDWERHDPADVPRSGSARTAASTSLLPRMSYGARHSHARQATARARSRA
jgi:hypothetical protein